MTDASGEHAPRAQRDLDDIVIDPTIYPRSAVDDATVERYADAISVGDTLPAIVIERGTGRILDGRHRLDAHRALGLAQIDIEEVDVPAGMTAKLYAASLSARHGLPLSDGDARALARDLYDADPDTSVVAVAKALGRARKTVEGWVADIAETRRQAEARQREVRRYVALLLVEAGWTQAKVAEHLALDRSRISQMVSEGDVALIQLDEGVLRDAVAAAPIDVSAIAEGWRHARLFAHWTDSERDLLKRLRSGETVVVNMHDSGHPRLWRWAEQAGLAARIDRRTEFGNPFLLPGDGDRRTVCDAFETHYWSHKPSLHAKIADLRGKALGCWCAPARCHGDFLADVAEGITP
ncbi:MAG: DUF4326 domain-containing protein [Acidimicrobiales bacterium]|nr:DUF4326 domain-containing protein [Acidimicrobiales bacterium]